jgi:hypothetical protein
MKEVIQKVGLGDVFAYICPGAILLCSLLLWFNPEQATLFHLGKESWQAFSLPVFLLILSYTLGLILAAWSSGGAALYLRCVRRLRSRLDEPWLSAVNAPFVGLLWLLHWIPEPRIDRVLFAEANTRMATRLSRLAGPLGLSSVETPWDWLLLFRTVIQDHLGKKAKSILELADAIHRRFLFSQGVALVCVLLAVQALGRLIIYYLFPNASAALPPVPVLGHYILLVFGGVTSFCLRWGAGRWWETEFVLTYSLSRRLDRLAREERRRQRAEAIAAEAAPYGQIIMVDGGAEPGVEEEADDRAALDE